MFKEKNIYMKVILSPCLGKTVLFQWFHVSSLGLPVPFPFPLLHLSSPVTVNSPGSMSPTASVSSPIAVASMPTSQPTSFRLLEASGCGGLRQLAPKEIKMQYST